MAYVNPNISKHSTVSKNPKPRKGYDLKGAGVFTKAGKILADLHSFTCPLCKLVLRNPHQLLECGCRYCEPCLDSLLIGLDPKCLEDGESVSKDEVKLDKGCLREINSLKIECPGSERSCIWTGTLVEYEDHYDECGFVLTTCECGQEVVRSDLGIHAMQCHLNSDKNTSLGSKSNGFGSMQMFGCQFPDCSSAAFTDHYDECGFVLTTCECGQQVVRSDLGIHAMQCPLNSDEDTSLGSKSSSFGSLQMLDCQFPNCSFTGDIETVNAHCMDHIHSLSVMIMNMQGNMKHIQNDYAKMKRAEEALEIQVVDYSKQLVFLRQEVAKIPNLEQEVRELKRELGKIESDSAHSKQYSLDSSLSSSGSSSFGSRDDFRSLVPRVTQLEEVRYLKPVVQQAKAEIVAQRSQLAGYMQTMQESVTRHSVTLDEIKLRQDILDVKTTHGVFIWKIPEIARRFRDAQDKRTISLYSPPFHTSPHGYRACIRAYLNGDGSGKTTHISVFFVLMKSEHDNLLKWPFDRPVTFELINQENKSQSITETFMPDKQSVSFQQPKSEMNVASGFPRFAPHSVLSQHQFIKGDAMYVRCKIDTTGLNFD